MNLLYNHGAREKRYSNKKFIKLYRYISVVKNTNQRWQTNKSNDQAIIDSHNTQFTWFGNMSTSTELYRFY